MEYKRNYETIVFTKALITFNKRVLMIKRSNYAGSGVGEWDIPGGGLIFDESPLDGINREIKEETGLAVRVDRLLLATTIVKSPTWQSIGLTYLGYGESDKVTLSHEHTDFIWATMEQLKERLFKPQLEDYTRNSIFEALNID